MEKNTLSQYGWIVVLILILCILIGLASPFGLYIKNTALNATDSFVSITYEALNIDRPIEGGEEAFYVDNMGVVRFKPYYADNFCNSFISTEFPHQLPLREALKYYVYLFMSDAPEEEKITADNWVGMSDKELNKICGQYFAKSLPIITTIKEEFKNNSECTSMEQAFLNVLYKMTVVDSIEQCPSLEPSNLGNNPSEEQINQELERYLKSSEMQEERNSILAQYENDAEYALYAYIYETTYLNIEVPSKEELTKEKLYKDLYDFKEEKMYVDAMLDITRMILYPETASIKDIVPAQLECMTFDEIIALCDDTPTFDCGKAFYYLDYIGGQTMDYVLDYQKNEMPNRLRIPKSYNNITPTKIPNDFATNVKGNVKALYLPDTITEIEDRAFYDYKPLEQINLENITTFGNSVFENTSLKRIELSNQLATIPYRCFSNCKLQKIEIPDSVTNIDYEAFLGNKKLEAATIPASVTNINSNAFSNCNDKLVIRGISGSAAEAFARNQNLAFTPIN